MTIRTMLLLVAWFSFVAAMIAFVSNTTAIGGWNSPATGADIVRFAIVIFCVGAFVAFMRSSKDSCRKKYATVFSVSFFFLLLELLGVSKHLALMESVLDLIEVVEFDSPGFLNWIDYYSEVRTAYDEIARLAIIPLISVLAGLLVEN